MTRQANAIDFWRGFALISIFINHVPGIYYTRFTHANYSMSDSADLFVFLAGWALRYVVGTPGRQHALWYLVLRLGGRALTLYAAQILITMIAIAMLAGAALLARQPAAARMAQRRGGVSGADPDPCRAGAAHASARLFQHPAALRGADVHGAAVRADRPLRAASRAAGLARDLLSRRSAFNDRGANLAGRGRVVLQPARLAADFRAGLRAGPRGRDRRFCTAAYRADPGDRPADRLLRHIRGL